MIPAFSRLLVLPALVMTVSSVRAAEGWTDDLEKAKATAAKESRDILINFTGSDWCPYCIQLKKEIFNKDSFKTAAPKDFVLVEIDFPKKKEQSDEVKARNEKLEKLYAVQGYPTVILADAQGRPYGVLEYDGEGGVPKYLEALAELRKVREKRDEDLKKAAAAEGVEKAKLIVSALEELDGQLVQSFYKKEIDEAIAADKDDVSGAAMSLKMAKLGEDLQKLDEAEKYDEFLARIDKFIKDEKLTGAKKQEMLMNKLAVYGPDKKDEALKLLDEVIAVDPKSEMAEQAKMLKESINEPGDAEPEEKPEKEEKEKDGDGEKEKDKDKAKEKEEK